MFRGFLVLVFILTSCTSMKRQNFAQIKNDSCLLFFESQYQNKKWSCTGAFLNTDTLVTAAHCAEAFGDSQYRLDPKNKVFGYCKINSKEVEINGKKLLVHPKYAFNDVLTNDYDIALLKVESLSKLKISSETLIDKKKIRSLVKDNKCFIAGYKETLDRDMQQSTIATPEDFIFLRSIHKKGIKFQNHFEGNKAIIHGGVAEKRLKRTMENSLKFTYPGLGYSGSALICSQADKNYKVGVYVGGFKSSNSWVSILFLDDISSWLNQNI